VPLLRLRTPGTTRLRLVTCSRSDAVERTLLALNQAESIDVCCSESRPAREGVALAAALLAAGVSMRLYSDAGLSTAIPGASALVVGADAVSDAGFINKVGTAALAALAQASGVPVLVLAGREKLVPAPVFAGLVLHADADPAIAPEHPLLPQISPLFERIPASLTSHLITDGGVLEVRDASDAGLWPAGVRII
jgi:translation initiation factor 2B subunit (eIF-2B alpha/beta/delta family)